MNRLTPLIAAAVLLALAPASASSAEVLSLQAQMTNGGWALPAPGQRAAACLVDTGLDRGQMDVAPGVVTSAVPGIGSEGPAIAASGPQMHGTWMTQFTTAPQDGQGMIGPTPGVPLIVVRAMQDGTTTFTALGYTNGMDRCERVAEQRGWRLASIGLALGGDGASTNDRRTVEAAAEQAGVPVLAAVGNRPGGAQFPASAAGVIGVSALNATTGEGCVSNADPDPEAGGLAAPGCIVTMPVNGSAQTVVSAGTSGATSLMATAVAQVCDLAPSLTPQQCLEVLRATARPVGGGSVIDLRAAAARVGASPPSVQAPPAPILPPQPAPPVTPVGQLPPAQQPGKGVSIEGPIAGAAVPRWYATEARPTVKWTSRTTVKVSSPDRTKKARLWTSLKGAKVGRYKAVSGRPRKVSGAVRITVTQKVGTALFTRGWKIKLPPRPKKPPKRPQL